MIVKPLLAYVMIKSCFVFVSANCRDPSSPQVNHSVVVTSYTDLALPGRSVQFSCPPTLALSGPNSSSCMGNGQWVPDPRETECTYDLHGESLQEKFSMFILLLPIPNLRGNHPIACILRQLNLISAK